MSPYAVPDDGPPPEPEISLPPDYVGAKSIYDSLEYGMRVTFTPLARGHVDEADVCGCESRYCLDCGPNPKASRKPQRKLEFWMTYYRLKRWLFKPTPWSK